MSKIKKSKELRLILAMLYLSFMLAFWFALEHGFLGANAEAVIRRHIPAWLWYCSGFIALTAAAVLPCVQFDSQIGYVLFGMLFPAIVISDVGATNILLTSPGVDALEWWAIICFVWILYWLLYGQRRSSKSKSGVGNPRN